MDEHGSKVLRSGAAVSHLTPDQLEALMARYYAGETVSALLSEFQISCRVAKLSEQFPPEYVDPSCPHCGSQMIRSRSSRTAQWPKPPHCSGCSHIEDPSCRCSNCDARRARVAQAHRRRTFTAIAEYCAVANDGRSQPMVVDDLAPIAGIALLTLIRTADLHGDGALAAVSASPVPFTATDSLSIELLNTLHSEGLISIDPHSDPNAFRIEGYTVVGVMPLLVGWHVTADDTIDLLHEIERRALHRSLPQTWESAAKQLHMQLAAAECRSYFDRCLMERGLPRNSSVKVDALIQNLLVDHSVSQAMRIIWGGAQWTADFLARKQVNRAHASNYAIGACQRWADRARAERWDVKGFKRPYDLPRSMLSYVLHDVILKVGDRGFDCSSQSLWPERTGVANADSR